MDRLLARRCEAGLRRRGSAGERLRRPANLPRSEGESLGKGRKHVGIGADGRDRCLFVPQAAPAFHRESLKAVMVVEPPVERELPVRSRRHRKEDGCSAAVEQSKQRCAFRSELLLRPNGSGYIQGLATQTIIERQVFERGSRTAEV